MIERLESLPLTLNVLVFGACACLVWWAGARLAMRADWIATRLGMSRSLAGVLLLAVVTSLPELATTVSAAATGAVRMATNNLLGGVAMQTAVLAIVDLVAVRGALTRFTPGAAVLLQGVVLMVLLGMAIAGAVARLPGLGPVDLFSVAIMAVFALGLWSVRGYAARSPWVPGPDTHAARPTPAAPDQDPPSSLPRMLVWFSLSALVILAAGWAVAQTGQVLATQTGLGGSFIGATLVAGSTSLPEFSTTIAAARRGAYEMALSNIFGSNSFCIALLLVADLAYSGGPVLHQVDRSAMFAASLGMVLTAVYLWGMLERRDRTILGMGYDSAAVLATYLLGLLALFGLRGGT